LTIEVYDSETMPYDRVQLSIYIPQGHYFQCTCTRYVGVLSRKIKQKHHIDTGTFVISKIRATFDLAQQINCFRRYKL